MMMLRNLSLPLYLPLLWVAFVLTGCSSTDDNQPTPEPKTTADVTAEPAIPAGFHTVSGVLQAVPAGARIDLALLQTKADDRPQRLLADITLPATGAPQRFSIPFNPQSVRPDLRIVLHGRATRAGMLIQRLPQRVLLPGTQDINVGQLRMVPVR